MTKYMTNEIIRLSNEENKTIEEISVLTKIPKKTINKVLENNLIDYSLQSTPIKQNESIREKALKNLSFLEKLENGSLVKSDYANEWAKPSGELVNLALRGQMALGYGRQLVYENILDEIVKTISWQKKEIDMVMLAMSNGELTGYKVSERIKAIKDVTNLRLTSMGIKSDKGFAELIDKIGNLIVSEERLMTEKAKVVVEETTTEKVTSLLDRLILGMKPESELTDVEGATIDSEDK